MASEPRSRSPEARTAPLVPRHAIARATDAPASVLAQALRRSSAPGCSMRRPGLAAAIASRGRPDQLSIYDIVVAIDGADTKNAACSTRTSAPGPELSLPQLSDRGPGALPRQPPRHEPCRCHPQRRTRVCGRSARSRRMKRDPALIGLSHDHHHALSRARKLRRAATADSARALAEARAFLAFFEGETARHFEQEERSSSRFSAPPTRTSGERSTTIGRSGRSSPPSRRSRKRSGHSRDTWWSSRVRSRRTSGSRSGSSSRRSQRRTDPPSWSVSAATWKPARNPVRLFNRADEPGPTVKVTEPTRGFESRTPSLEVIGRTARPKDKSSFPWPDLGS